MRKRLREGALDDKEIEIDLAERQAGARDHGAARHGRDGRAAARACSPASAGAGARRASCKIAEAMKLLVDEEAAKLVNEDEIRSRGARQRRAERHRLHRRDRQGRLAQRASAAPTCRRQGVQRDLLPLVEGTTVSTKYGMVKTDHILFIASGAFHLAKPSDLIPELQGRFPIRVELASLSVDDFEAILTEHRTPAWSSSTRRCWRPRA